MGNADVMAPTPTHCTKCNVCHENMERISAHERIAALARRRRPCPIMTMSVTASAESTPLIGNDADQSTR
jgi:hypothetical protein